MTSIGVESTQYFVEDRSWMLGLHGSDETPPCTLDVSTFTANTHFPNGFIKSGIALGVITAATASGGVTVVGPYDPAASDGRQVCRGLLFSTVKVPNVGDLTKDVGSALLIHGFVRKVRLPLQSGVGSVDAAAQTALKLIDFV